MEALGETESKIWSSDGLEIVGASVAVAQALAVSAARGTRLACVSIVQVRSGSTYCIFVLRDLFGDILSVNHLMVDISIGGEFGSIIIAPVFIPLLPGELL